ncbi:hypothetical protein G6514_002034 [Epicoccum nigrum]|nr:hypothetical protein G6514_002034 [Epicoccum nigrum]
MADPGPRRVSKAYMLGLSDKPFKAPPSQPSNFNQIVSTPGGIIEWTASDGRRGTLTGPGKVRALAQAPSQAAPETIAPETTAPETTAPETAAPETAAPETAAPETAAPITAVPVTAASNKAVSTKAASNKAASNKAVTDKTASNKAASKAASNKGGAEDDGMMGIGGIFDEAPAVTSDKPAGSDWTEELDKKLLEWKAHNHTKPWHIIGHELGKGKEECKERFQLIKPKDWRPASGAKQGGTSGTNKEKIGNDEKGRLEKKNGTKNSGAGAGGWGDGCNDNSPAGEGPEEKKFGNGDWGTNDGKSENKNEQADEWGNNDSKGEKENDQAGGWGSWDGTNDKVGDDNAATGFNDWDLNAGNAGANTKPPSQKAVSNKPASNKPSSNKPSSNKPPSNKPPSNKPSADKPPSRHPSNPSPPHPRPQAIYELQPDALFSASDLRLIARILQQDCSMVWERVSWRFRDKTGRKLHADLFEEKVTGGVEKKSET